MDCQGVRKPKKVNKHWYIDYKIYIKELNVLNVVFFNMFFIGQYLKK